MKVYKNILLFVLLLLPLPAAAQDVGKHYVSRHQDGGNLYFIRPMELFMNGRNDVVRMDFTKAPASDSIKINYTFIRKDITPVDRVIFEHNGVSKEMRTEKLYIEPHKKSEWEHRYSVTMPLDDMVGIFKPGNDVRMILSGGDNRLTYRINDKKWKDNTLIIQKIILMINMEE